MLDRLLPGARVTAPDSIADAAVRAGVSPSPRWPLLPTYGQLDPFGALGVQTVLDIVLAAGPPLEGNVIVVSDDHLRDRIPFDVVIACRLRSVLEANEAWFMGRDLVLIAPEQRRVVVIHHEGAYAHIGI